MGSGKTTKSVSDQSSTQTSTPNVPTWISDPAQAMAKQVAAFTDQGPGAFTPGISDLQKQANAGASGLTSSPYYKEAADSLGNVGNVTADQVTGQSLLTGLSDYETPYRDQVLNPVLNDFDANAGVQKAAQAAAAARNSAFSGSRYGVLDAQSNDMLGRARSSTEGTLLDRLFTQATGLSADDANRRQGAMISNQGANLQAGIANQGAALSKSQLLAGLGSSQGADARANVALQGDIGAAATAAENEAKQYPLKFAAQNEALLQGIDPRMFTGSTTTGVSHGTEKQTEDPGLLDYIGKAAQVAALFVPGAGAGGSGGAGALFGSGPSSFSTRLGNYMNNDPSGMWRLGQATGA
jgi:hypothetical protein